MFFLRSRWRTALLTLLTAVAFAGFPAGRAPAAAGFPDAAGHWGELALVAALRAGWVSGYPDGTFRPDSAVTRAEFVKLLLAGQDLSPTGPVAMELLQSADWSGEIFHGYKQPVDPKVGLVALYLTQPPLADMAGHWLQAEGWLETAQRLGVVVTSDYTSGHSFVEYPSGAGYGQMTRDVAVAHFAPDALLTRQEATVMVARALGLVYPAEHGPAGRQSGFADASALPAWAQGYVAEVTGAGILKGYPDNRFGPDNPIKRAEAVSLVQRTRDAMHAGSGAAQVFLRVPNPAPHEVPVDLPHTVRVIDGRAWLPVRAVLEASLRLNGVEGTTWTWQPITQTLTLRRGLKAWASFQAGRTEVSYGDTLTVAAGAPLRLMGGVLYAPPEAFLGGGTYDAATRRVVLPVFQGPPPPPNPS